MTAIIEIGSPNREMEPEYLLAPGGFAWWYADLITPEGDGLVLIWSYGLPFLPGYADGARRGDAQLPTSRPSINVVAYERGRPSFYLLQEYRAASAEYGAQMASRSGPNTTLLDSGENAGGRRIGPLMDPAADAPAARSPAWKPAGFTDRIGDSCFASRVVDGRRRLEVTLDCPVPGSAERLVGTVRIDGVARVHAGEPETPADAPHLWTPLTGPAKGRAVLRLGDEVIADVSGRAYHDRNGGRVPLHDLGIQRWIWGRYPLAGRELIVYLLWPDEPDAESRQLALWIDADGTTHHVAGLIAETAGERCGFAGIRWPEEICLRRGGRPWARIRQVRVADNGPFYLRFQSEIVTAEGERALGWAELCSPGRVDQVLLRPLVRMRVHHAEDSNSMWLPLFAGQKVGRVGRLLRSLALSRAA